MSSQESETQLLVVTDVEAPPGNTVATIGLVLTIVAGLMCGMLFKSANRLAGLNTQASAAKQTAAIERNEADAVESEDADALATKEATAVKAALAAEVTQQAENSQRLQVLLLASATVMLNLVGLVLNVVGLLVPNRPRSIAVCGMILSLLLFAGVFGVMAVGALLTPVS
jgi:hypothetical protein